jgi:hypothetical protein
MMNITGTTVVHVLSGPTRQMLRRSMGVEGVKVLGKWPAKGSPRIRGQRAESRGQRARGGVALLRSALCALPSELIFFHPCFSMTAASSSG